MDECIEKGILKDFLIKCRAEVIDMILTDFNQEEYEKALLAEGEEEGIRKGIEQGIQQGIHLKYTKGYNRD